ncbi:MAG: glutamate-5-semialdehyde dehydrogenase [Parachlamydiales bacterium]|jgi:glutamate-5-semialdehyde dehydrogenase
MSKKTTLNAVAETAKKASLPLASASTKQKNDAIKALGSLLKKHSKAILEANLSDIHSAKAKGLDESMIDRLSLQGNRLEGIIHDLNHIIELPDPVGECFDRNTIGSLQILKCRTPIGVLGVIYESRPNVTIDIAALAIKSGNCALLRGGSETLLTNTVLVKIIQEALTKAKLPKTAVQMIPGIDREQVKKMLRLHGYIDLIIPRGGAALHQFCRDNSSIPVITGGIGICHLFVDESAHLDSSLPVISNAKVQRPTVCNALDTLLVHESIAAKFIPQVIKALGQQGVSFRLDDLSWKIIARGHTKKGCIKAGPEDWDTEWLSLVLGIKVVKNLEEAIDHIHTHSSGHSDGILTENPHNASHFIKVINSAAVYINASTRFTDGGQLGLGAEVAISTQKLHARGPMGLKELTTYKWIIKGNYTSRQ